MRELLPCPFCGKEASISALRVDSDWWSAQICCDGTIDSTCSARMTCGGRTREDAVDFAIRSWNRRDS